MNAISRQLAGKKFLHCTDKIVPCFWFNLHRCFFDDCVGKNGNPVPCKCKVLAAISDCTTIDFDGIPVTEAFTDYSNAAGLDVGGVNFVGTTGNLITPSGYDLWVGDPSLGACCDVNGSNMLTSLSGDTITMTFPDDVHAVGFYFTGTFTLQDMYINGTFAFRFNYSTLEIAQLWLIPLSQVVMLYRHQQVWPRPDACRWRSCVGGDSAALVPLVCGGSVGR